MNSSYLTSTRASSTCFEQGTACFKIFKLYKIDLDSDSSIAIFQLK